MAEKDRSKNLQTAMDAINKRFGPGSAWVMGDSPIENVPCWPTDIVSLDDAIGIGGIPRGRITEIYGDESVGKTTLALHIVSEVMKRGGNCVYIDVENALDTVLAEKIGVDTSRLIISQPNSAEEALEITQSFLESGGADVIVVDSVAALVPKAELEGDMGDSHMGLQARLMSQAMRKLSSVISESKTALIFINQTRMKIGMVFGNPETTTGGKALRFYASLRLHMYAGEQIKSGNEVVGRHIKVKCEKNKVAPPFKTALFRLYFGKGISKASSLIDAAIQNGVLEKSGSYITFGDSGRWNGEEKCIAAIDSDQELFNKIYSALVERKKEISAS